MNKLKSQALNTGNRNDPSAASEAQSPPTARATRKGTVFHLVAAAAKNVLVAADVTGWGGIPLCMSRGAGGTWQIKVPLPPGRYRYRFLVDLDSPESIHKKCLFPFGTLHGEVAVNC